MTTILVTGGAGYIGSATVRELIKKGYNVLVVDNLSKGKIELLDKKAKFYKIDLVDEKNLSVVFLENKIDAVIHLASYKAVGESMDNAVKYSDNLTGTIVLLKQMIKNNVKKIIFSSSAAVYGLTNKCPIDENTETNPINYYGHIKLVCEDILRWYSRIHNISYVILRYFNVAGDCGLNYIDPDAQNIMPIIMEVIFGERDKFIIFGDDYDTPDGTCIRDYIDINDLVRAHILALNVKDCQIINLGTQKGISVKEFVDKTMEITGKKLNFIYGKRREGDTAKLIASNKKAENILGWKPQIEIKDMLKKSYDAYCSYKKL